MSEDRRVWQLVRDDELLAELVVTGAQQPDAAYHEIARILTSGGRAVLTCWEPLDRDDERIPERLRRVNLGTGLTAAGFGNVEVRGRASPNLAKAVILSTLHQ